MVRPPTGSAPCPYCSSPFPCRKGRSEPTLVPSTEANARIPQKVITFYESKLTWHDNPEDAVQQQPES